MQHAENNNRRPAAVPSIQINGGSKTYSVKLVELSSFLDQLENRLNIDCVEDLELNLQCITDLVVDGINEDLRASELKNPLILLRELTMLFRALLYDVTPEGEVN